MSVIIIAAISENNCIGKNGAVPWRIPEDLKRFRELTTGHVVIMGRKTWESIPAAFRPLPKRTNIVLTRNADYPLPHEVERASSLEEAIAHHPNHDIYIIGGADVYASALPLADRMELTRVHERTEGDTFFPSFDASAWEILAQEDRKGFSFVSYHRIPTT